MTKNELRGEALRSRLASVRQAAVFMTEYHAAICRIITTIQEGMEEKGWKRLSVWGYATDSIFGGNYHLNLSKPEHFIARYPGAIWVAPKLAASGAQVPKEEFQALAHVFSLGEEKYEAEEPESWLVVMGIRPTGKVKGINPFLTGLWDRVIEPQPSRPEEGTWDCYSKTDPLETAELDLQVRRVPLWKIETPEDIPKELVEPILAQAVAT